MALEIKLNQKLSQTLIMTPQLQQAIKLLQLGRQEYIEVIEKELLENPALERDFDAPNTLPPEDLKPDNSKASEIPENAEKLKTSSSETNDLPFEDFAGSYISRNKGGSFDSSETPSIEATVSQTEGMTSHLLWQLRTSDLNEQQRNIAAQLIGNIDRNGYLDVELNEVAMLERVSEDEVEKVLKEIQTFDPPGIACRDLRECLLIQLEILGMQNSVAWVLVDSYLPFLEVKKYDEIASQSGLALEEIYEAVKQIRNLEPRPGRPFIDEEPIYITPDIYVRKISGEYVISLNDVGMPKLRLNETYKDMAKSLNGNSKSDKEYLQNCLKSASWLIRSVEQRQQTLFKVTSAIFEVQQDFLDQGVEALKPLVLKDVASRVEMHESTISRVTTNKYVHTPQGVYELKFFFTSGLFSSNGSLVSSESVKDRIKKIIASEDQKKPLSDQAIAKQLKSEGIDVARRTVAKYREMMGILSSSKRKKLF